MTFIVIHILNDSETFERETLALAHRCFHYQKSFQNGLSPSFMPTQQRPNRALTEPLANQFHLICQHSFQTGSRFFVSLCSLFLSASTRGRFVVLALLAGSL
ncbi:Hypothetical_protein [Hexamita inflata]|uniref:Hypothetical_protein n=1 Tax=Hexamita inflata TaxID=28002 RepID=A0AA86NKU4_9EUKA|nr:Hypothetical protein HINF_LOCUS8848 [Hexamita inflata]